MEFVRNLNINFLSKRKVLYILSLVIISIGLGFMIFRGGPNLGIDFTGGTLVQLKFEKNITNEQIRDALKKNGFEKVLVQRFVGSKTVILKIQESAAITKEFVASLNKELDAGFVFQRSEMVGPTVGDWLLKRAGMAFSLAFLGIIFYVGIRFKGGIWGVSGVIALIHDVLVILGIFFIFNKEITITVVAGLMTVIGYSINDTIVIYDRIRENLRLRYKDPAKVVFNDSINQTLTRTIVTSGTTLLTVLSIFIFGGKVIKDFSFTLLLGVILGTYSSIFIASPIVYDTIKKKKR